MSLNIFVSYSTRDLEQVSALQAELSSTPIKVYVAQDSMPPGVDINQAIKETISQADAFVLVWSKNARDSEWVLQELGQAVALRKPILPIVLDADVKLPLSISSLKYISVAADPVGAMKQARDFLYANYEARRVQIEAAARVQQEQDNLVKLGLAGLAFWLLTKK
jgi:16S rRNA G1207 methylase RsmC